MLGMVPVASSQMQRKNTFSAVTLAVVLFRLLPPSAWMHTSVDASDGALFPRLCVRYCATIQYRVQYVNLTYPRNDKYSGTGARQAAIQPPTNLPRRVPLFVGLAEQSLGWAVSANACAVSRSRLNTTAGRTDRDKRTR